MPPLLSNAGKSLTWFYHNFVLLLMRLIFFKRESITSINMQSLLLNMDFLLIDLFLSFRCLFSLCLSVQTSAQKSLVYFYKAFFLLLFCGINKTFSQKIIFHFYAQLSLMWKFLERIAKKLSKIISRLKK